MSGYSNTNFWGKKNQTKTAQQKNPKPGMIEEHEKKNSTKQATKLRYAISIQLMTEQRNVSYQVQMGKGLHDWDPNVKSHTYIILHIHRMTY